MERSSYVSSGELTEQVHAPLLEVGQPELVGPEGVDAVGVQVGVLFVINYDVFDHAGADQGNEVVQFRVVAVGGVRHLVLPLLETHVVLAVDPAGEGDVDGRLPPFPDGVVVVFGQVDEPLGGILGENFRVKVGAADHFVAVGVQDDLGPVGLGQVDAQLLLPHRVGIYENPEGVLAAQGVDMDHGLGGGGLGGRLDLPGHLLSVDVFCDSVCLQLLVLVNDFFDDIDAPFLGGETENGVAEGVVEDHLVHVHLELARGTEEEVVGGQEPSVPPHVAGVQDRPEVPHEQEHGRADDVAGVHHHYRHGHVFFPADIYLCGDVVFQENDLAGDPRVLEGQERPGLDRAVDGALVEGVGDAAVVVWSAHLRACGTGNRCSC